MGYFSDATMQAFRGTYNLGLFFRLDTFPALHLWWGVSDKPAAIPNLDVAGTIYIGGGWLADVPDAIEVLINGNADRADWTMDGVPEALTANLYSAAPSVVGKRVDFAMAPLDSRWQLMTQPTSIWVGTADFWAEEQAPQTDVTKPKLRRLTLATLTGDASRSLPFYATWTDRVQKAISPTDSFCGRVPRYYPGQIVRWPRF